MLGLSIFLVFISMIAFFVCLILLIVNAIKKNPLKPYSLFRKVFLMYSSDLKLYIIHIFIIFIHF